MAALFAAGMATFVLLYDTQALLPELRTQFAVTPAQATLTMSLATAGLAVALLVAGPASERIGRTRLILGAVWSASLLALLCPLAPSWHALLGLRLLEGVALAGLPAVATAYLREELHPTAQARAAGLYIGGTALGWDGRAAAHRSRRRGPRLALGDGGRGSLRAGLRRGREPRAARLAALPATGPPASSAWWPCPERRSPTRRCARSTCWAPAR